MVWLGLLLHVDFSLASQCSHSYRVSAIWEQKISWIDEKWLHSIFSVYNVCLLSAPQFHAVPQQRFAVRMMTASIVICCVILSSIATMGRMKRTASLSHQVCVTICSLWTSFICCYRKWLNKIYYNLPLFYHVS